MTVAVTESTLEVPPLSHLFLSWLRNDALPPPLPRSHALNAIVSRVREFAVPLPVMIIRLGISEAIRALLRVHICVSRRRSASNKGSNIPAPRCNSIVSCLLAHNRDEQPRFPHFFEHHAYLSARLLWALLCTMMDSASILCYILPPPIIQPVFFMRDFLWNLGLTTGAPSYQGFRCLIPTLKLIESFQHSCFGKHHRFWIVRTHSP